MLPHAGFFSWPSTATQPTLRNRSQPNKNRASMRRAKTVRAQDDQDPKSTSGNTRYAKFIRGWLYEALRVEHVHWDQNVT